MAAVEILHDMESATVDVKVDVARFEVGGRRLPHRHLGVQILDEAPGCIADALAMDFGVDKQQLQFAVIAVNADDSTADYLAVSNNIRWSNPTRLSLTILSATTSRCCDTWR